MSDLENKDIYINELELLKDYSKLKEWLSHFVSNEEKYSIDSILKINNEYLRLVSHILISNKFGKIEVVKKLQDSLCKFLHLRKKVNRVCEVIEILNEFQIPIYTDFNSAADDISGKDIKDNLKTHSIRCLIDNPEKFISIESFRKDLIARLDLIDSLEFIEAIYKAIPAFFRDSDHIDIMYKYCLNTKDNNLIDAINTYVAGRKPAIGNISLAQKEEKVVSIQEVKLSDEEDYLSELADLRLKLVEGCKDKNEYVNTLFEISKCYQKLGQRERAFFIAVIVNRLSPNYRNVSDIMKI